MDIPAMFGRAVAEADARVREIGDHQWQDLTPDENWSVRDLVSHLVGEDLWRRRCRAGSTLAEVAGRPADRRWSSARILLQVAALMLTLILAAGARAGGEVDPSKPHDLADRRRIRGCPGGDRGHLRADADPSRHIGDARLRDAEYPEPGNMRTVTNQARTAISWV